MIDVPRETRERLDRLCDEVVAENKRQNLISPATVGDIENRHIVDSLQLLACARKGLLVDIGSGAGFPGLVLACCRTDPVHLIEPRTRRAEFLQRAAEMLGLAHVQVWSCRVERAGIANVDVITARAVASLANLFDMASSIASQSTRWVLPKGRSAQAELDTARQSWQGEFELVPSITDPDARIVLARNVRRRP